MGIYIKDMEMPKSGYFDVRIRANGVCTTSSGESPFYKEYAVLEVPTHGRLIDADNIGLTDFEIVMCNGDYKEALKMLLEKIEKAPTIIPAEK